MLRLAIFLSASIIGGWLGGWIWFKLSKNPKWSYSLVVGLVIGSSILLSLYGLGFDSSRPVHVTINVPIQKTIKGNQIRVQGTVSPIDSRIYVLIHPISTNKWWVQSFPDVSNVMQSDVATWTTIVYLGTESNGQGETFEVIALASADPLLEDIFSGHYLSVGEAVEKLPLLSRSNTIIFLREE